MKKPLMFRMAALLLLLLGVVSFAARNARAGSQESPAAQVKIDNFSFTPQP